MKKKLATTRPEAPGPAIRSLTRLAGRGAPPCPKFTPRSSSTISLRTSPPNAASMFTFLPAEDGIRDATVTGVQTCALPISLPDIAHREEIRRQQILGDDDELRP